MKVVSRIALIVGFLSGGSTEATTIVVFQSYDGIVIAADSKRTATRITTDQATGDTHTSNIVIQGCKIRNFGDIALFATGVYDPAKLPLEALRKRESESIRNRINRFAHETASAFRSLNQNREGALGSLTYVLGFLDKGRPILVEGDAFTGKTKEIRRVGFSQFGQPRRFDQEPYPRYLALYNEIGLYDALDLIIRVHSHISPAVGGPVDILHLNANGSEWIQKKRECRERE